MIMPRAQAKDLKLNVEVNPNLPRTLYGDDVRIRQIVTNLLTNAVKYTITGSVTLRFNGEIRGDKCILHVEVEDTGIGIKQENISKLFEAFERIEEDKNRQIEGTGLGINITVQLLNLMGSSLEVNSIYGTGSKFFFDLEQTVVDSSPIGVFNYKTLIMEQKCDLNNEFTAEEASVLVVDDNAMNRKVFRSLLKPTRVQV
jgi:signal transduction histidine kinase